MAKDGCNNMEKNQILRHHDDGVAPPDIAAHMRLTERIVNSIINHYRPAAVESEPEPKAKKKSRKKAKKKTEAAEDFK